VKDNGFIKMDTAVGKIETPILPKRCATLRMSLQANNALKNKKLKRGSEVVVSSPDLAETTSIKRIGSFS